ncbi:hypothetical protein J2X01_003557 [Arthrobacter ginsengisoli]|uniref:Uncharacterized protein n=1 Tax=Arthrobacter ginsengisoli TaxID=1356565 RepID=A0ABU1UGE5_9MICC|nr:hypothetical protein [Arthrobacter ginsengisoli]
MRRFEDAGGTEDDTFRTKNRCLVASQDGRFADADDRRAEDLSRSRRGLPCSGPLGGAHTFVVYVAAMDYLFCMRFTSYDHSDLLHIAAGVHPSDHCHHGGSNVAPEPKTTGTA